MGSGRDTYSTTPQYIQNIQYIINIICEREEEMTYTEGIVAVIGTVSLMFACLLTLGKIKPAGDSK